ncbi:hypothetical protein, partial [Staphylococcus pseudintermedius]
VRPHKDYIDCERRALQMKNLQESLKTLVESEIKEVRISILFLKVQKFLIENKISEEERKVLARMLDAYYKD